MIKGIVCTEARYVCEADKDTENPTIFHLRPLTAREYAEYLDKFPVSQDGKTGGGFSQVNPASANIYLLEKGLLSVDNLDGKTVPGGEAIDKLPTLVRMEIATKIFNISTLSEGDEGN